MESSLMHLVFLQWDISECHLSVHFPSVFFFNKLHKEIIMSDSIEINSVSDTLRNLICRLQLHTLKCENYTIKPKLGC